MGVWLYVNVSVLGAHTTQMRDLFRIQVDLFLVRALLAVSFGVRLPSRVHSKGFYAKRVNIDIWLLADKPFTTIGNDRRICCISHAELYREKNEP